MIRVKVPASTSNLGPGFDSIGMALDSYLEIEAEVSRDWQFNHRSELLHDLPADDTHYLARMVNHFCRLLKVEPFKLTVTMTSTIPLARGLGSSGTVLIASLLIVNHVRQLKLSTDELIQLLSAEEGHPDNVVPSLLGGLVVGCHDGGQCYYEALAPIAWPMYAVIPDYELKTADARNALPFELTYSSAVRASAVSNVLVAALSTGNYDLAGQMMMQDLLHEPYRKHLIKDYTELHDMLNGQGYAFLSGAGPTLFVMARPDADIEQQLRERFLNCEVRRVNTDTAGAVCYAEVELSD
ncbi:homoserine kinase [Macrococcus equipercicus]|uniref:Homoserine kinase n=1 Tax=Macrococcus equipercicus TaxID=69967 RepID=A0A9Q9BS99_9STAP|nr:homoserine kinase [Macrococcus equipercicus]UTH14794.1 homoserine kinase [Macrococcus equipercicus]